MEARAIAFLVGGVGRARGALDAQSRGAGVFLLPTSAQKMRLTVVTGVSSYKVSTNSLKLASAPWQAAREGERAGGCEKAPVLSGEGRLSEDGSEDRYG